MITFLDQTPIPVTAKPPAKECAPKLDVSATSQQQSQIKVEEESKEATISEEMMFNSKLKAEIDQINASLARINSLVAV